MTEVTAKEIPARIKRSESFFGIHFDFHAGEQDRGIGESLSEEMLDGLLQVVKPDFLQCDCKGHPGFSSYPTKIGNAAPGIVKDILRIWREATAKNGVSLYMHYSGVWDTEAIHCHPTWACVDENGNRDKNITSVFGPYVDELMIPQIEELYHTYGVDGVWVDGECWAADLDYNPAVLKLFEKSTHVPVAISETGDVRLNDFLEFCREGFRTYLKHYVDEIHRRCPGLEIASNWAYTSYMPDPVSADVDFCSGDITPQNAVNAARFEARCLAHQGKPWDLMSWGFSSKLTHHSAVSLKPAIQLMQEGAVILSQGGGYQIYFRQKRDGFIKPWQVGVMTKLAKFCRERQEFCHYAKSVPQIGLLLSSSDHYRHIKRLFTNDSVTNKRLMGILQCILDSQYSVDVLMEHSVDETISQYPLIILPECSDLQVGMKDKLTAYVRSGGTLLVMGTEACAQFACDLNVLVPEKAGESRPIYLSYNNRIGGLTTTYYEVKLANDTKGFGKIYSEEDFSNAYAPAASITVQGKGRIAGVYVDLGEIYTQGTNTYIREFVGCLVKELFPHPIVEVKGSHLVDVCVMRHRNNLAVNLINTGGPHANGRVDIFDEIPPIGPLQILIRTAERPDRIVLEPENEMVPFTYDEGILKLTLQRLNIHSILCLE